MDEDSVVERIRADADQLDTGPTDINALVEGALVRGRGQRTRRRFVGALTCAVAAGLVIALLGALPSGLRSATRAVPAGRAPQVSASSSPAKSRTPAPPAPPERVSGTPAKVQKTLEDLLPVGTTVTHASHARDTGSNGFAWEHTTALTVHDAQGTTYVLGGIGDGTYEDGCLNLPDCTKTSLAGGTLWITSGHPGDKSGVDLTFNYNRPHGGHIWIMELNYADGFGPVTRKTLLLSKTEARRMITSSTWDTLFKG